MAAKIEKIVCKFVGDFDVADNIVRNGEALCKLSAANENRIFNKLMAIQAGSIVEAALSQIIYRAKHYNREGVPNISEEDRLAIAATTWSLAVCLKVLNHLNEKYSRPAHLDQYAREVSIPTA